MRTTLFSGEAYDGSANYTIPDGYTEIGKRALICQASLETLVVPGTVRKIGEWAFAGCKNLKTVVLQEGIEEINENVFNGCDQLSALIIPDSVKWLSVNAFWRCDHLKMPVYNVSRTILHRYPPYLAAARITVTEGVKEIAKKAFGDCKETEEILLPESLERIGWAAFERSGIRQITLPAGLKDLGAEAFYYCKKLKKVTVLTDADILKANSLRGCDNLETIEGVDFDPYRMLRVKGQELGIASRVKLPEDLDLTDHRFCSLSEECGQGDTDAMMQLAEYFAEKERESGEPFYALAANFWRLYACERKNVQAKTWILNWMKQHPGENLPVALSVPVGGGSGDILNALGFSFFEPGRSYSFSRFEDGVVEASSYSGEDGPDEDGFGREIYYDYCYLTDDLSPIPGVKGLYGYSYHEKRVYSERFLEAYNQAAEWVRARRRRE